MTSRDRRVIEAALSAKGFALEPGRDHRYYRLMVDGKRTAISTFFSLGSGYKEYGDSLLAKVAKQLGLTKAELLALIDCDLDGPSYLGLLRALGKI